MSIIFRKFEDGAWKIVERNGYWYDIDGYKVELFRTQTLLEILGGSLSRLYGWERREPIAFPRPMFRVEGHTVPGRSAMNNRDNLGHYRYYSRRQLELIRDVLKNYPEIPMCRKTFRLDSFFQEIRGRFYKVDIEARKQQEKTNGA